MPASVRVAAPAVRAHGLDDAVAALRAAAAAGTPLVVLSAPGGGAALGPLAWTALAEAARQASPGAEAVFVLDCGDAEGHALRALRGGAEGVLFVGRADTGRRLAAIAAAMGRAFLAAAPAALDLAEPGARARLAAWIAAPPTGAVVENPTRLA